MLSELQAIADALSQRLGRSVALDDPSLRLLVHTPHQGGEVDQVRRDAILHKETLGEARRHLLGQAIAQAPGPVRVSGSAELSMLPRICAPVRHEGELLGYLWMLDDERGLDADALQAVDDAAGAAGAVMYQERLRSDIRRGRERELLRDLLTDDATVRRHAADALREEGLLLPGAAVLALVVQVPLERLPTDGSPGLEHALASALRSVPRRVCSHLTRADHGVLLLARGRGGLDDAAVEELAGAVREQCLHVLGPDADAAVGVGEPVKDVGEAVTSYWQARRAIDVARVVPSVGPVAWWSRLGVYGLLVELGMDALPAASLPSSLRRLFEVDRNGVLAETLEVYLDNAGDPSAAVEALSIHRTTLYYRLGRVTELTGMDLRDGGERLAVHLGLKVARLTRR